MESKFCRECEFFIQHYVKLRNKYVEAGCGHCINGRFKTCAPQRKSCEHFLEIKPKKAQL